MDNVKEKVVCGSPPELLETVNRWRDALEGSNKEMAFELFNQVLDRKITNEVAFTLLDNKQD